MLHSTATEDLKSRHTCTDIPCCILFVVAIVIFVPLYIWSCSEGHLGRLYHGINYRGQICGVDPGVENTPYLFWCTQSNVEGHQKLDLLDPICVSQCPGSAATQASNTPFFTLEPGCAGVTGTEGLAGYETKLLFHRYCIPHTQTKALARQVVTRRQTGRIRTAIRSLSSIPSAWPILVAAFFIAVIVGYAYLFLLRHCAEVLIWATMALSILVFGWTGMFIWTHAEQFNQVEWGSEEATDDNEQVAKVIAMVFLAAAVLLAVIACCLRHSIAAAAACLEVACQEIFAMPSLLLLPMFKSVIKGVQIMVLLYGFLKLISTADVANYMGDGLSRDLTFTNQQYCWIIYYIFMSFWLLTFTTAVYQFTVAFATAEYYFTEYEHDQVKDVGCCAVWDGLHVGIACHAGSLAFGSMLIAVLETLQKVVEYAERKSADHDNQALECILACCLCCIHSCKNCVEYLSKFAYVDIAITSDSFCTAARNSVAMVVEMGGAMAILNGATFAFSFFGNCIVAAVTAALTYRLATSGEFADQASTNYIDCPVAVMVVGLLIGLYVAMCFMDLLDMTSDTLLYCYGWDMRDGKLAHTAPPALRDLVHSGEHGKAPSDRH